MLSRIAICMLVIAVAAAGYCFSKKLSAEDSEIDRFAGKLNGIRQFIHPGSAITLNSTEKPVEHLLWARYLLFPARIDRIQDFKHDTILLIINKAVSDSAKRSLLGEGQVIWNSSDEHTQYLLLAHVKA